MDPQWNRCFKSMTILYPIIKKSMTRAAFIRGYTVVTQRKGKSHFVLHVQVLHKSCQRMRFISTVLYKVTQNQRGDWRTNQTKGKPHRFISSSTSNRGPPKNVNQGCLYSRLHGSSCSKERKITPCLARAYCMLKNEIHFHCTVQSYSKPEVIEGPTKRSTEQ